MFSFPFHTKRTESSSSWTCRSMGSRSDRALHRQWPVRPIRPTAKLDCYSPVAEDAVRNAIRYVRRMNNDRGFTVHLYLSCVLCVAVISAIIYCVLHCLHVFGWANSISSSHVLGVMILVDTTQFALLSNLTCSNSHFIYPHCPSPRFSIHQTHLSLYYLLLTARVSFSRVLLVALYLVRRMRQPSAIGAAQRRWPRPASAPPRLRLPPPRWRHTRSKNATHRLTFVYVVFPPALVDMRVTHALPPHKLFLYCIPLSFCPNSPPSSKSKNLVRFLLS